MPSTPADAAGLLRTAIRDDNPVVFIEHKALYVTKGEVPDDPDFMIPFGKAKIVREGTDATVVATHTYVQKAVDMADRLYKDHGISVEVIDPRTLVPFDKETVINSVKKTGRAVVVHEAHQGLRHRRGDLPRSFRRRLSRTLTLPSSDSAQNSARALQPRT